jgi:hypothetical protein
MRVKQAPVNLKLALSQLGRRHHGRISGSPAHLRKKKLPKKKDHDSGSQAVIYTFRTSARAVSIISSV